MNAMVDSSPINALRIEQEHYAEALVAELEPLLKRNWEESPSFKADIKLDIDWPRYKKLDDLGMVMCVTGRINGELIGYCIWFIVQSFNYKGLRTAHGTAFYVKPEHRGNGVPLLRGGERLLKAQGIKRFYWFCNEGTLLHKLLLGIGYDPDELVMEKIL
jgi:GNAT superfamily N-acetyltransferase